MTEEYNKAAQADRFQNTPFVFHFDVGNVGTERDERYAVAESFALRGSKPITFRSWGCNDAMTVGSIRLGTREGGLVLPAITLVDDDDRISSMKLGMSFFAGDDVAANFCAAIEHMTFKNIKTGATKVVNGLSAHLRTMDVSTWTYDREKMGLDLWLTSAYYMKGVEGSKSRAIFRYGFALSASQDLTFSKQAFEEFWKWLVHTKYYLVNFKVVKERSSSTTSLSRLRSTGYDFNTDLPDIHDRMSDLHDFLLSTFSQTNQLTPSTGFLRATKTHLSITHDCFHIYVKLIPDINFDEKVVSTLFLSGIQYDPEGKDFGSLGVNPLEMQAYSILSVLEDLEMLFEMGLLRSYDQVLSEEREILPLRSEGPFTGNYEMTENAALAFHFLATAGLRKVAMEEVFVSNDSWDVYDIAAGCDGIVNLPSVTAITCMLIQVCSPILLAIRAATDADTESEVAIDVYFCRVIFAIFFIFYELKLQSRSADEVKLSTFLTMLPEFNSPWLIGGIFINLIAKLSLSIGIVTLLWFSYSVFDVTLNSVALYFILDIDNYLVSSSTLEKLREQQKDSLFHMKFVSSRNFFEEDLVENEFWTFDHWPLFSFLFYLLHIIAFAIVSIGAILNIVMPFFLKEIVLF